MRLLVDRMLSRMVDRLIIVFYDDYIEDKGVE